MVERALDAMRELNGRTEAAVGRDASRPSGCKIANEAKETSPCAASVDACKQKVAKRSRLPAAAVKEMRCARAD